MRASRDLLLDHESWRITVLPIAILVAFAVVAAAIAVRRLRSTTATSDGSDWVFVARRGQYLIVTVAVPSTSGSLLTSTASTSPSSGLPFGSVFWCNVYGPTASLVWSMPKSLSFAR